RGALRQWIKESEHKLRNDRLEMRQREPVSTNPMNYPATDNFNDLHGANLFRRIASVQSLFLAWRKVRANRGAAGIDAVNLRAFEAGLEANLRELSRSLLNKSYQPMPARYVTIAKANGKERELGILTVRD